MTTFAKAELIDNKINITSSTTIKQSHLSSECWSVQAYGLDHCTRCELRDTGDCGGEDIRDTGKNELGFKVPLSDKGK